MTVPRGYRFATRYAGIRKAQKDDLILIVSDPAASAAAVFTQNRVQAAPVRLARSHLTLSRGKVSALLINAGNANCATRTGDRVAAETCKVAAHLLSIPMAQVLPASTGVIGMELDASLIVNALPQTVADLSADKFQQAAEAIMTTDTRPKTAWTQMRVKGGTIRIAGMTKGAGMIQPMMATTLGFVLTDAKLSPGPLRAILKRGAESSYNRMSVDGDTSTNDTLALLANGASGFAPAGTDLVRYEAAVSEVMQDLARQIARDGEGAKKLITIEVEGAADERAATRVARGIANSPLVKTAVAGSDPNWGRIICAAGNAGVAFDPSKVDITIQGVRVCTSGLAAEFSEDDLKRRLDDPDCLIRFRIRGQGKGRARFWTCDFTEGYIHINASYRT
ncbi:MAG: bifunctional glutamate N-acetyltransferase/amino-acid acetyltransferase ArgJ [Bryobacteraceae bacterium]